MEAGYGWKKTSRIGYFGVREHSPDGAARNTAQLFEKPTSREINAASAAGRGLGGTLPLSYFSSIKVG
jgi:hypothetical protein